MQETSEKLVTNEDQKQGGISMFTKMKKQLKNEKGLTLVELLAVIVIIAIIAAIAIPAIGNIITNSKYNAVKADALNVLSAAQMYYLDNPGASEISIEALKDATYLENAGIFEGDAASSPVIHLTSGEITNADGLKLTTESVTFATGKTVTFTGATVTGINKDTKKGSKDSPITIEE